MSRVIQQFIGGYSDSLNRVTLTEERMEVDVQELPAVTKVLRISMLAYKRIQPSRPGNSAETPIFHKRASQDV